jgi:hypothetical protein
MQTGSRYYHRLGRLRITCGARMIHPREPRSSIRLYLLQTENAWQSAPATAACGHNFAAMANYRLQYRQQLESIDELTQ